MPRPLLALLLLLASPLLAQSRVRTVRPHDPTPEAWLPPHVSSLDDLAPLVNLAANARVVGLGDATHGTHELFELKQRMLPLLAARGLRTIAVEAGFGEWQAVRDYVRNGTGDPRALIESHDYFFFDTEETLAIIEWARAWNAAGNAPVDVVAIDASHPHATIDRLLADLLPLDATLANDVRKRYACIDDFRETPTAYGSLNDATRAACHASILGVRPLLEGANMPDDLLHEARVVEQGEESLSTLFLNRDAALAENIAWLADRGKVAVWAHNEHLGKTPYTIYGPPRVSAGTLLAQRFGHDYIAIGSILLRGSFNAFGNGLILDWPLDPPASDDAAVLFARAGLPGFFLDLRQPLPRWLLAPLRVRTAGSSIFSPGHTMFDVYEELPQRFDAVVYIETSTPTLLRHRPVG